MKDGMKTKETNKFIVSINVRPSRMEFVKKFSSENEGFILRDDDWKTFHLMTIMFPNEDLCMQLISKL